VAVLAYSPLCRSLLGGRLKRGTTFDPGDIRAVDPKFQEPRFSQYLTAGERLAAFAQEHYGKSVLELAARWVLDRPGICVALWGARRPDQLDAIAGVMGWKLDTAAMAQIDQIVAQSVTDPVGPEYLTPTVRDYSCFEAANSAEVAPNSVPHPCGFSGALRNQVRGEPQGWGATKPGRGFLEPALIRLRQKLPSTNLILPTRHAGNRLRISDMLFHKNPLRQRVRVIRIQNRNSALQHHHPMVQVLVHKMHRASGNLHPVIESLRLRIKPRKRRQQRRMNIQDPVRERRHKLRREQPHVPRQANQVHIMTAQAGGHVRIVLRAAPALGDKDRGRQAKLAGRTDSDGIGNIGNDDSNFHARQPALAHRARNRQKIGPPAREQDADAERDVFCGAFQRYPRGQTGCRKTQPKPKF